MTFNDPIKVIRPNPVAAGVISLTEYLYVQTDLSPYLPSQTPAGTSRSQLQNASSVFVPHIVFFALLFAGGKAGSYAYQHGVLWTSTASFDHPPWYFIGLDLVHAISYFVALTIFLVFVCFTRARYGQAFRWLVPMSLVWMGNHIAIGIVALIRTGDILDSSVASSHWQSQAEYLNDPLRSWVLPIAFASALAAGLLFKRMVYLPEVPAEVCKQPTA